MVEPADATPSETIYQNHGGNRRRQQSTCGCGRKGSNKSVGFPSGTIGLGTKSKLRWNALQNAPSSRGSCSPRRLWFPSCPREKKAETAVRRQAVCLEWVATNVGTGSKSRKAMGRTTVRGDSPGVRSTAHLDAGRSVASSGYTADATQPPLDLLHRAGQASEARYTHLR